MHSNSAVQLAMQEVSSCCTPETLLGQCAQSPWKNILEEICHLRTLLGSDPHQASLCNDSGRHCNPPQWHCRCIPPVLTHPSLPNCPKNTMTGSCNAGKLYTYVHASITALAGFWETKSAQTGREGGSKCTAAILSLSKLYTYTT